MQRDSTHDRSCGMWHVHNLSALPQEVTRHEFGRKKCKVYFSAGLTRHSSTTASQPAIHTAARRSCTLASLPKPSPAQPGQYRWLRLRERHRRRHRRWGNDTRIWTEELSSVYFHVFISHVQQQQQQQARQSHQKDVVYKEQDCPPADHHVLLIIPIDQSNLLPTFLSTLRFSPGCCKPSSWPG